MNTKQPLSQLTDSQKNEDRYLSAQAFMQGYATQNLIQNDNIKPIWINSSDSFWYTRYHKADDDLSATTDPKPTTKIIKEYRIVNAHERTNLPAFDVF